MKTCIVVSGGDAPGINTTIARYTMRAQHHGDEVIGAIGGFAGVLTKQFKPIDRPIIRLLEGSGGSYLPTGRDPVLAQPDALFNLRDTLAKEQIDNILLFGGDGTLRHVLPLLKKWGISVITLPTTIDNDIPGTEQTLGFDSACNFAYGAIEGVLATAHALPGRIFMVETLGGHTGYIALDVAYASGAHAVLIPEVKYDIPWVAERLKNAVKKDNFGLLILSEGVPNTYHLSDEIAHLSGSRVRYTQLGHAQRGGPVSHRDRRLATEMAHLAYDAFRDGVSNGGIIVQNGVTRLYQGTFGEEKKPKPNINTYHLVNGL